MLRFLSTQAQERFRDLQGKLGSFSITDEEQRELADLVARAQKVFQERDSVISRLKLEIAENVVTITDLFSAADIRTAMRQTVAPAEKPVLAGRRKAVRGANKAGSPVLIRVKVGKGAGAPSKYCKGQKLPAVVPKNFKALDTDGALSDNLSRYYTDEGRIYFATPEGRAELATLQNYIQTGKTADT